MSYRYRSRTPFFPRRRTCTPSRFWILPALMDEAPLCSEANLRQLQQISEKLERDAFNAKPAHKRLNTPKYIQLARHNMTLSRPASSAELLPVPGLEPSIPECLLIPTSSWKMHSLPESASAPGKFRASVSKLGLPLEASVSHRNPRAPPWSPVNAREREMLERSLQERAELSLSMRIDASRRTLVPQTLSREPRWNSAQLGFFQDWPKGLLRPMGDGGFGTGGLGIEGQFRGDGTASRRVLGSFDVSKSGASFRYDEKRLAY